MTYNEPEWSVCAPPTKAELEADRIQCKAALADQLAEAVLEQELLYLQGAVSSVLQNHWDLVKQLSHKIKEGQ